MKFKLLADDAAYYKVSEERFFKETSRSKEKFSGMILYAGMPHMWIDHLSPGNGERYRHIAEIHDIRIVWMEASNYGYSLFFKPGGIAYKNSLSYYQNCVKTASKMGANGVFIFPSGGLLDGSKKKQQEYAEIFLTELSITASDYGQKLILGEGIYPNAVALTTLEELQHLYHTVHGLHFLLDTYKMYHNEETPDQWFDAFGDRIAHIRLRDGRYTGPCICGQGCYPIKKFLQELVRSGYDGTLAPYFQSEYCARQPEQSDCMQHTWILEALT